MIATVKKYAAPPKKMDPAAIMTDLDKDRRAKALEALQYRKWKQGDVYAPHDLSAVEMKKWRGRSKPTTDVFDVLAINPLNEYKVCGSPDSFSMRPPADNLDLIELFHDVGIHDALGSNQAPKRHRLTEREPAANRQSHSKSYWDGVNAKCA